MRGHSYRLMTCCIANPRVPSQKIVEGGCSLQGRGSFAIIMQCLRTRRPGVQTIAMDAV